MTLATKNGSIIVKDGKLAENCGCCGWYCFENLDCPCNYSKALPQTLKATLSFSLSSNMYGMALGNFQQASLACWRTTPQEAAQINGTYTLTKNPYWSSCVYEFEGGGILIRVIVGTSSGSFNYESILDAGCSDSQTNVHLSWLGFSVPAKFPEEYWSSYINNLCPGHPAYINNAASRTYTNGTLSVLCPQTMHNEYYGWDTYCNWQPRFPIYNMGFRLDGAAGGRDTPACLSKNLEAINHSWAFDVVYTDTSGSAPAEGRLSRAVTLTVTE